MTATSPQSFPSPDLPNKFGNFDLIRTEKLGLADIIVSKYRSRETGLTVVHLDYEAPLVNGYFVVATEIFNDSGCPHTLEHLVFMGSEKYPYKGIIDHFANRGFSNGTNAWTDTDHTAYTVSTAGEKGLLQMLPIYIDHILYPTITDASFITEVHHIDPKGEDSGVVYSEMQGRENSSGDIMALKMQRLLNLPDSAYRSETGGLMEALRSLTVEQIREYHKQYYVPHNLSLIITGKMSKGTPSILSVLQEQVEPSIVAHGQNYGPRPVGWKRPFLETPSANRLPIAKSRQETVTFPEKDESLGELVISYLGPPPSEFLERKALDILSVYLTSSPVAPLNKEYVEVETPLCTYIYFYEDERATRGDLAIYVGSVPVEHLATFPDRLRASLAHIAEEGLDMERMAMVINRDERQLRSRVESSKGDAFSTTIITDFLYGKEDGSELLQALNEMDGYDALRKWSSKQWTDLLKKYYIDPPSIVVRGRPSAAMAEKLEKDEKARIAAQVKKLGSKGLQAATKLWEKAKAEHDKPIPDEIIKTFPVPDVKSISWIPVDSVHEKGKVDAASESKLRKHIEGDGGPLPFSVGFDHVQSDFVTISAYASMSAIPNHLRPHISTYVSSFFSLPVERSTGERLSHEEVVNKLDDETVAYGAEFGTNNTFEELLRVSIKVEKDRYETAISWLKDLFYGSKFDKERLQITVAKIQQSLPEMKRNGKTVLSAIASEQLYDETSTPRAGTILKQAEFIPGLIQQLQDEPKMVIGEFEAIRKTLTSPEGIRFSVTGNILGIQNPKQPWRKHFGNLNQTTLQPVPFSDKTLSALGKEPANKALVVSLSTIESSFVYHTSRGVQGFNHPDLPALRITLSVMNATESYLWRYIRGSGLAYGAYISNDTEAGLLTFSLYRSSSYIAAYEQAAKVVRGLVDGSIALNDTTLDAAKSSIVFDVARNISTPGSAALTSFVNRGLKGLSSNHSVELLEKYQAVKKEDVMRCLKDYILELFKPESSIALVVTAPGKSDEISEKLGEKGFKVEKRTIEVQDDEGDSEDGSTSDSEVSER
ncbi:hypothetical protein BDM02DRAFT_3185737 [Thelephora ganbajun]|uniref:Uncharacterized protein n=1 Tax=Thelephora ganbajun TaxID=370292 RepID=A0ACB6ZKF4_THEGA|nr:hypothetical protein BDM02DRAFT_3185737 [Thelephora ganbajun]